MDTAGDKTPIAASPPTQRVVAVVELLAASPDPLTAARIADALGLNRSTTGSILQTLQHHGWVRRRPDLTYRLGPALPRLAARAGDARSGPDELARRLDALADDTGCGVALLRIDGPEVRFDAVVADRGPIPAGITAGARLPLAPPAAATLVAHGTAATRRAWLAAAPPGRRATYRQLLADVQATGTAVWGVDADSVPLLEVLAEVVAHLTADPGSRRLRQRVLALLGGISGDPYRPGALDTDEALPISYLAAPVFTPDGVAAAELLIGPLRAAVDRAERRHYLTALTDTARRIGPALPASAPGTTPP